MRKPKIYGMKNPKMYVVQDSRQFVGNCMLFWQKGGGYTCHLDQAERFTKEAADLIHENRATDIKWPLAAVTKAATLMVDVQRL